MRADIQAQQFALPHQLLFVGVFDRRSLQLDRRHQLIAAERREHINLPAERFLLQLASKGQNRIEIE